MSYGEKVNCTCGEPHISDRIIHRQNGLPCYVKEQEKRCPYSDCFRVYYKECSVHGEGTHDHIFSSPCLFVPVQKEKTPEWEDELQKLWAEFCTNFPQDMGGATSRFIDSAKSLIRQEKEKSLQEEHQALRKKVEEVKNEHIKKQAHGGVWCSWCEEFDKILQILR